MTSGRRAPRPGQQAPAPGQALLPVGERHGSQARADADPAQRLRLLADLVVLDRDPFLGQVAEIAEATVVATYVDGEPVFG